MNSKFWAEVSVGCIAIAFSIALQALVAYPAMLLWNLFLVPAVNVAEVGWLQMWGIMIMCALLFRTNISVKGK